MAGADIVMYSTAWCPFCERARALLMRKGLQFREVDVEDDPGLRDEMQRLSGRRTVPQVFVRGTHVGGWDELSALERSGALDALVLGA